MPTEERLESSGAAAGSVRPICLKRSKEVYQRGKTEEACRASKGAVTQLVGHLGREGPMRPVSGVFKGGEELRTYSPQVSLGTSRSAQSFRSKFGDSFS